jgi:AcrR family transcriptional regulator
MAGKSSDVPATDEDPGSKRIVAQVPTAASAALREPSIMDWPNLLDGRPGEHGDSAIKVSSKRLKQPGSGKGPPRARILSSASELFLKHGIAGVSVDAIVRAAGTSKPAFYYHFVSKDELVAECLRESAKQVDACWSKIDNTRNAGPLASLSTWLTAMADGVVDGWACHLTSAAAELNEKTHPARRVTKAHKVLQRRRLTRLCRAAGLRTPSMVADVLLLLFDGACVMASNTGRVGLNARFVQLGEATIAAHTKIPVGARHEQRT